MVRQEELMGSQENLQTSKSVDSLSPVLTVVGVLVKTKESLCQAQKACVLSVFLYSSWFSQGPEHPAAQEPAPLE